MYQNGQGCPSCTVKNTLTVVLYVSTINLINIRICSIVNSTLSARYLYTSRINKKIGKIHLRQLNQIAEILEDGHIKYIYTQPEEFVPHKYPAMLSHIHTV